MNWMYIRNDFFNPAAENVDDASHLAHLEKPAFGKSKDPFRFLRNGSTG